MALPSTKPLEGVFWYVLDDENNIVWRPCPKIRGDFYLGWLGQNKNVVGAGLVRIEMGHLTHICTHGTPYYWLQPYAVLPVTADVLRAQHMLGADTMALDFSLAGWGVRPRTLPQVRSWPDAPLPEEIPQTMLNTAVKTIVRNFRSEGEPPPKPEVGGLLARTTPAPTPDPLDELLELLREDLGEANMVPVLIELVKQDVNVMPRYRQSDFFENMLTDQELPSPRKVASLVLSAIYHLAPLLGSRRLSGALLLNSLRQRHPFDVTWCADFLIKCYGMPGLLRLLQTALLREQNDQMRGNILDLLQELGYGFSDGMENEVLTGLDDLMSREGQGAFAQVISSHLAFIREYIRQRDTASQAAG